MESLGLIYFLILIFNGEVIWIYAISFLVVAYLFTVLFSIITIITEELTYHQYTRKGMGWQLVKTAFSEPILNHPFILYAALKGNFDYYFNKKIKWGEMTRKGMSTN